MVQDFRSAYRASLCFILISTGFLPLSKSFQATLAAQAAHHPSHENWRKIIRGGDQSLRSRKFDDAIDKYQDAIDEAKKVKAEDSLLAQSYSSMARAYKEKRDLDKAEEYYRKALALRKSELGDDAENTLRNLEDLSYCLWAQRKYREVESVLKEVLDINPNFKKGINNSKDLINWFPITLRFFSGSTTPFNFLKNFFDSSNS